MLTSKIATKNNIVTKLLVRNFSSTPSVLDGGNQNRRRLGTLPPKVWFQVSNKQYQWNTKEGLTKAEFLNDRENPFPLNPFFKPNTPLNYDTKDKIFNAYKADPTKNTPRALAEKYNISIRRIEAILKIRMMQKELVQDGFVLQSNYQDGMEKVLGAKGIYPAEPLEIEIPKVKKPIFIALDEEVTFNQEKAAEFLGKKPYVDLKERLGDKPFEYHGLKGDRPPVETTPPKVIETNPLTANRRFTYCITDIDPNLPFSKRQVTIREKSGVLREASKFERKLNLKREWPNQKDYFRKQAQL